MPDGLLKMPEPMVLPTTTAIPLANPIWRIKWGLVESVSGAVLTITSKDGGDVAFASLP